MQTVDHITLNVRGMHCGSCVARIRRALSGIAGVETATVDLASGTVRVSGAGLAPAELVELLTEAGYEAGVEHEGQGIPDERERSPHHDGVA